MSRPSSFPAPFPPWTISALLRRPQSDTLLSMRVFLLAAALGSFVPLLASPLATGTATKIPESDSYLLRFTVSEEAQPGIRLYPMIRLVLDDGTSIDGMLGCCVFAASRGANAGGEVRLLADRSIPEGRTVTSIAVMAKEGNPSDSYFGVRPNEGFLPLDETVLKRLETEDGHLLHFAVVTANP